MKIINLLLLLCFFSLSEVLAQTALPPVYEIKTDTTTLQDLDNHYWQIFPDSTDNLTITDVSHPPLESKFYFIASTQTISPVIVKTYWLRFRLKNLMDVNAAVSLSTEADKADFYVFRAEAGMRHYISGKSSAWNKKDGLKKANKVPIALSPNEEITIYQRRYKIPAAALQTDVKIRLYSTDKLEKSELQDYESNYIERPSIYIGFLSGLFFLAAIFNFLIYRQVKDKVYLYFSLFLFFISIQYQPALDSISILNNNYAVNFFSSTAILWVLFLLFFVRHHFQIFKTYARWDKFLIASSVVYAFTILLSAMPFDLGNYNYFITIRQIVILEYLIALLITVLMGLRKAGEARKVFLTAMAPFVFGFLIMLIILSLFFRNSSVDENLINYILGGCIAWAAIVFSSFLFKRYGQQQKQIVQDQLEKERILAEKERERNEFIAEQKIELERQVKERTVELKQSLEELKSTQSQLIQSEKMASLGELTAGIAHEIQNPLNFVNNFSEVSNELLDEMKTELAIGNKEEAIIIADDVKQNLEKILHHGKRADAIVKGMLQHSQTSTGQNESTDINKLADEYLRLAYHNILAKNKSFNATLIPTVPAGRQVAIGTDFDETIGNINIIPQDIGKVLLNLYNNAFYAVSQKAESSRLKAESNNYEPTVSVSTKKTGDQVLISVKDNGNGIPEKIVDKIFQPFFTTKPTGQGTGLGLSLSYDIVKAHGGELRVETKENEGSEFIIQLPII